MFSPGRQLKLKKYFSFLVVLHGGKRQQTAGQCIAARVASGTPFMIS
jgi:hypothetical protein